MERVEIKSELDRMIVSEGMKEFEQQALKSGFTAVKRCNYAGLDFCFKFERAKG